MKKRRAIQPLERTARRTWHHGANQQLVLRILQSAEAPMTAYEILHSLRRRGIKSPLTVYRALKRLMDLGHVHRLESINAYLACTSHHYRHGLAVFTICRNCRHVDELAGDALVRNLQASAIQHGFHVEVATIELKGQCASCAGATAAKCHLRH